MPKFKNSIVVVTGASRGIGLAIAERLAREDATVALVARNAKALNQARKKIRGKTEALAADVRQPGDVERLFKQVNQRHGRLDILVNCAGIFSYKPFSQTTIEEWRDNIETNLTALFLMTQAALPLLKISKRPQIVNILSVASLQTFPNCSAYTAAKFGALGLTRVLREEFRPLGIRVTAVLPGPTETQMLDAFGMEIPRERLMQPEDTAEAVLAALTQPARTVVEEILLKPSAGSL